MTPATPYSLSDLPIRDGVCYHLGIRAADLSQSILLVGDPERVDLIADEFLERIEIRVSHRGLTTVTGIARATKQRITVTTSGMGAPSAEIVLNELALLSEVDTNTLTRKPGSAELTIIRVGTSGALQSSTPLGAAIISSHAVGLDSSAWFYAEGLTRDPEALRLARVVESRLSSHLPTGHPAEGKIHPYGAVAHPEVVRALSVAALSLAVPHELGVTVTAPGFFAPQGRDVGRVRPSLPDLDRLVAEDPRFLNMDMETAFVLHFCGAHGFRSGAICVAAANRALNTFATDVKRNMADAVGVAVRALRELADMGQRGSSC